MMWNFLKFCLVRLKLKKLQHNRRKLQSKCQLSGAQFFTNTFDYTVWKCYIVFFRRKTKLQRCLGGNLQKQVWIRYHPINSLEEKNDWFEESWQCFYQDSELHCLIHLSGEEVIQKQIFRNTEMCLLGKLLRKLSTWAMFFLQMRRHLKMLWKLLRRFKQFKRCINNWLLYWLQDWDNWNQLDYKSISTKFF